jgi:hypothetical protein
MKIEDLATFYKSLESQFKQPLPHFPLACRYCSYEISVGNRITWSTIFQDAQKIKL